MSSLDHCIALCKDLIRIESITPEDKGCQPLLSQRLVPLGFEFTSLPHQEASNFWGCNHQGRSPCFVFAGHTDVVPTGPLDQWQTPPFEPTLIDGVLYGRGSADMKASLAAMWIAIEEFVREYPDHPGSIGLLITSAEEGPASWGTPIVLEHLADIGQRLDYCLVGEPTSSAQVGDTIKNGRRGSLTGELIIKGKQGHIAYPHLADNPIHRCMRALHELSEQHWDNGNDHFQATSLQISNIHSGTGAGNVIPGELTALFNFRYCTEVNAEQLMAATEAILQRHALTYELKWEHFGKPFLTPKGRLIDATQQAIQQVTGRTADCSTSGGTSDGRYIAAFCPEVIELGPCNASIHQVNENVAVNDVKQLALIYGELLRQLLLK